MTLTVTVLSKYCHFHRIYSNLNSISFDISTKSVPAAVKFSRLLQTHSSFYSSFSKSRQTFRQNLQSQSTIKTWKYQPAAFIMSSPRPSSEEIQSDKETFLNMSLEEKRSRYKCEDKYVTLAGVPTWKEYFVKEKIEVIPVEGKTYEVNDELNSKVSMWEGDITALEIDSIVNAANSKLLGGGGVDGAIHRAAGPKLLNECRALNGCPAGEAKISGGYRLPAKYIIHTVGPQGELPEVLRSAYLNSLKLMVENQLRSTAFPCISTGVYGYPQKEAADVALGTVREFLEENADKVDRVIFTVFLPEDKKIYEVLMQKYFPLK